MATQIYRFHRVATTRTVAELGPALQFAQQVTRHLNEAHFRGELTFGMELFGQPRLHWYRDLTDLDATMQDNLKLLQDERYQRMLAESKGLWLDGGAKDTIIKLVE